MTHRGSFQPWPCCDSVGATFGCVVLELCVGVKGFSSFRRETAVFLICFSSPYINTPKEQREKIFIR